MLTTLLAAVALLQPPPALPVAIGDGDLPEKPQELVVELRLRRVALEALETALPEDLSPEDRVRGMVRRAVAAAVALPEGSTIAADLLEASRSAVASIGERPDAGALLMEMATRSARRDLAFEPIMEAPLPVGFPYPAPAGEIRVAEYPRYRMARAEMGALRSNGAFFTLFRHISDRDIAMTAPVEMTVDPGAGRTVDMGFMYRTPDMGTSGTQGRVQVEDVAPMTVVTMGVRGRVEGPATDEALARLERWVAESVQWEAAGNPRLMGYNGPGVPRDRQFAEVQIPIRKRATTAPGSGE